MTAETDTNTRRDADTATHEVVSSFLENEKGRDCHILNRAGGLLCGRTGLAINPHGLAGSPLTSPCAGGCGRERCPDCAAAWVADGLGAI